MPTLRRLTVFALAALLPLGTPTWNPAQAPAQAPVQPATFLAADVHSAPTRAYPSYFSVLMPDDRLVFRDATLLNLITTAYDVAPENVQGGPPWLERDRFDVIARVPAHSTLAEQKLMLRALLAYRFHLTLREATLPMPAWLLTAGPRPRLKPSVTSAPQNCSPDPAQPASGGINYRSFACTNTSTDTLVELLHNAGGGYLDKPIVNATHLDGDFDFTLHWSDHQNLGRPGHDPITLPDAVQSQLGLKLTLDTSPRPVISVTGALRTPTPNAANLDKILPPPPVPQFEVATIKPSKPGGHGEGSFNGGTVDFKNVPLRLLIDLAWDLNEADNADNLVNAPKWLGEKSFDILAKASPESAGHAITGGVPMDIYEVELMLRALLIERFQMKVHLETQPIDSFVLTAASPRLKPAADPAARTVCAEGPGPDGKDPRIANPALNRLVTCRNMSIPELCDELQRVAGGYVHNPVQDATNLTGRYDFTLSFSSNGRLAQAVTGSNTEPDGSLSLAEALSRQLGLKLEKTRRPLPVLVIDHIEEKPTEN